MGNLLGHPVTSKETERGSTPDGRLVYAVSSMQGWRVHMEDAHIVQPVLYAERRAGGGGGGGSGGGTGDGDAGAPEGGSIEASLSADGRVDVEEGTGGGPSPSRPPPGGGVGGGPSDRSGRVHLPDHSLFAVFDGHGGRFAADYSSRNLLRVLSRQERFVSYATRWNGRADYLDGLREELAREDGGADDADGDAGDGGDKDGGGPAPSPVADGAAAADAEDREARLRRLRDRGAQSDERTRRIKERVRRHLDGEGPGMTLSRESQRKYDVAKASYDHELMTDLEDALQDAFCDADAEILRAVQGRQVEDANGDYNEGLVGASGPDGAGGAADADASAAPPPSHGASDPVPVEDEDAGTTACVVLLTPLWIVCANAGDTRSVYSRSGRRCVPLSYDHKPDDEGEERRVRDAGGYVSGGRVEGDLAVSRGLGDYRFKEADVVLSGSRGERAERSKKHRRLVAGAAGGGGSGDESAERPRPSEQKVSPVPDIIVQSRDGGEDEFVLIACDGIWDVVGNQEGVDMVAEVFGEGEEDVGLICEEVSFFSPSCFARFFAWDRAELTLATKPHILFNVPRQVLDLCLMKGSKDNMTAAIIKFPRQTVGSGGGVAARRASREAPASPASAGSGGDGPSTELYVPPQKRALSESNMVDEDAED